MHNREGRVCKHAATSLCFGLRRHLRHQGNMERSQLKLTKLGFDFKLLCIIGLLILASCRRDAEAPAAPKPPAAPIAAAPAQAPQPATSPRHGWTAGRAVGQSVDVLIRADAPGLDPGAADGMVRPIADEWRKLAGVEHVVTRSREGEIRALVRFAPGMSLPDAATAAVAAAWQANRPAELATPHIAWIPKGNRARIGWALTSFDGGEDSTALAVQLAPQLVERWPALGRVEVAGTVRPVYFVDVLTKTALERGTSLSAIAAALRDLLLHNPDQAKVDAGPQSQNRAQAVIDTGKIATHGPNPPIELSRVVALRRGLGGPVRAALVGRNEAVLLRGEAGNGADLDHLEATARTELQATGLLGARRQLYPQTLSVASRIVLELRPGQTPEVPLTLAKRLLAVRETQGVVGAVAMQGLDGIPETLDADIMANRRWTVWVTTSSPNVDSLLTSVIGLLSDGPWRAYLMPNNLDTALAWVLDGPAAAGVLLASGEAGRLAPAVSALGEQLQKQRDLDNLRSGPQRRAALPGFARVRIEGLVAAHLSSDDAALALGIVDRAQLLGQFGGADVWLDLPGGAMAAEFGSLPLAWSKTGDKPALLGDVIQLPSDSSVLERIRCDGDPALFVLVDNRGVASEVAISAFRDSFERAAVPADVRRLALTLADPRLGQTSCLP